MYTLSPSVPVGNDGHHTHDNDRHNERTTQDTNQNDDVRGNEHHNNERTTDGTTHGTTPTNWAPLKNWATAYLQPTPTLPKQCFCLGGGSRFAAHCPDNGSGAPR